MLWNSDKPSTWRIWKLIPVKSEGTFAPSQPSGSDSLPSYSGNTTRQLCTCAQHTESDRDDLGTIVTEITTIRKRYRVADA